MNRRDFLKSLAGIPLLGLLKPKAVEAAPMLEPANEIACGPDGTIYAGGAFANPPISNEEYWAMWNGESWSKLT